MDRVTVSVSGEGSWDFLQGLITIDLTKDLFELSYGALLSPQGKFLFDFFIFSPKTNEFIIDIDAEAKEDFLFRLSIYKLRLKLDIKEIKTDLMISKVELADWWSMPDPRNSNLGFRNYSIKIGADQNTVSSELLWEKDDYEHVRIKNCIPQFSKELITNETYILEANFVELSGVSFTKGCFVGQEVTARMRHKTELRKGIKVVTISSVTTQSSLKFGAPIFSGGKKVGHLLSRSKNFAMAYLRFDKMKEQLKCDGLFVEILK